MLLTNCGTHLLLAGAGLEETQYYSSRVGDTTVQQTTHSTRATSLFATEHTWSTTEARRRLFTVDADDNSGLAPE